MNVALFTKDDLVRYSKNVVPKHRTRSYFIFGLSLARLLYLPPGLPAVHAFSQLMEEWEYFIAGSAMQGVKYVLAKNSSCIYPSTPVSVVEGINEQQLSRPSIYKFQNTVVYEYLDTTNIGLELDYLEVIPALCDTLHEIYGRIFTEETFSNQLAYETIVRLDTRIKHHIINCIAKELTEVSNQKVKANVSFLRSISGHISMELSFK
jgi:hypothetical protein